MTVQEVYEKLLADSADGTLDPEELISAAEADPEHPLRPHLDLDDKSAGHSWRVHQCRQHLRSLRIEIRHEPSGLVTLGRMVICGAPDAVTGRGRYGPVSAMTAQDIEHAERRIRLMIRGLRVSLAYLSAEQFRDLAVGALDDPE